MAGRAQSKGCHPVLGGCSPASPRHRSGLPAAQQDQWGPPGKRTAPRSERPTTGPTVLPDPGSQATLAGTETDHAWFRAPSLPTSGRKAGFAANTPDCAQVTEVAPSCQWGRGQVRVQCSRWLSWDSLGDKGGATRDVGALRGADPAPHEPALSTCPLPVWRVHTNPGSLCSGSPFVGTHVLCGETSWDPSLRQRARPLHLAHRPTRALLRPSPRAEQVPPCSRGRTE